jgi:hypothetical protein
VWRSGAGAPSNALGINGDFYLDNVTGNVYAKSGGEYAIVANIVGPSGPTGPTGPPGSNTLQIVKITADYNVLVADDVILVDATAGTVSVFLPDTALALPKLYTVKRIDTAFGFNVIVNSAGGIIDNGLGNLPVAITNGTYGPPSIGCAFGFIPDGLAWWIVSMY